MAKIYDNITQLIGGTPLMEVKNLEAKLCLKGRVLVKLEYFNPAGSVKDRVAFAMLKDAESRGVLKPGATIIEPTSGNTGIGLAAAAAATGYKSVFVMPESMSVERRKLLLGYGAEIVLTDAAEGMKGAIEKAKELAKTIPNSFLPGQFDNAANPKAHYETTGPEIYRDTDGQVDVFVSAVGTGGTLSGTGKYLKEQNPSIEIVAVEPYDSPVLSGGKPGPHKIQGIGAGFIPETLDREIYDQIIKVKNEDAFDSSRLLAHNEGILTGISSGASLYAAIELAKKDDYRDKVIVAVLPDTGERYLSTELFEA